MNLFNHLNRRKILFFLGVASFLHNNGALAQTEQILTAPFLDAVANGLKPNSFEDQSIILQFLLEKAARLGLPLFLRGGDYRVANIKLPANITLFGVSNASRLIAAKNEPVLIANGEKNITINNIVIDGGNNSKQHLIFFNRTSDFLLEKIKLRNSQAGGFYLENCQGAISQCDIANIKRAAIHLQNCNSMLVSNNRIENCKNGGILIWRYESGYDGSIITNNKISKIGSESGSGQNGNGINAYQADEIIIANNNITDCAFSAIRVNSTNNIIINANICTNCQEVAIFSEFAFSASIISDNLIDRAALGISVSNFDYGGRLAIISNNIVRNIFPFSPTNPDVRPTGIYAEADSSIYSNLVENVPGIGIVAGWGPYLRNVMVKQNTLRETKIGIAVSVVEGVGPAYISDNIIEKYSLYPIIGMRWLDIKGEDLSKRPDQFPIHKITDNYVN